ncbi:MAG: hypothetical protein JOZ58_05030 [Acetobacteraceae bacterium]|nr:hypothetical protein [Acetobacteraceae bacterium]
MPDLYSANGILVTSNEDAFGDLSTGNYAISHGVAGWRSRGGRGPPWSRAAPLIVFALWVLGSTTWHAVTGTLPQAELMGVVGVEHMQFTLASVPCMRMP